MKIYGARVGTVFEIFDNPEGKKNDDWTRIRLQRSLADYCVGSFQYYSFDDADVQYDLYWKMDSTARSRGFTSLAGRLDVQL